MALAAVNITIGQSLGEGQYSTALKNASLPAPTLTTLLADITAALAVSAISGDPTATTAVTLVQTDANALVLALSSDVSVVWDTSTITKRNQLRRALTAALRAVESGYGGLAE